MAQARIEKYKYGKIYTIVENKEDGEELIYRFNISKIK